jgi:hypothetical protein
MQTLNDRSYTRTIIFSSVVLLACLLLYVTQTMHWPLVGDAALMHYDVFLMDHGMALYRDVVDPNMPTTLLIEGEVVHLFGGGALAWRLFDFFLLVISGIAMIVICRPYDWFAGFFAAALYALIHGRDGPIQLGQRDLTMTAFLLIGVAFLFEGLRTSPSERAKPAKPSKPWMTALFGVFCGAASTIKPSVLLLTPVLLVTTAVVLKRRQRPFLSHLICGILGMLAPMAAVLAYVVHKHILKAFLATLFDLLPYFVRLDARSYAYLITHSISSVMLPITILWLPIALTRKNWLTWERGALLVGVAFGLASFCLQRKGYPYHRYPSEAFLLLLIAIDFTTVFHRLDAQKLSRRLASIGIVVGTLLVGGGSTIHALRQDRHPLEFTSLLESDLNRLGQNNLAGHVQCLDMADGCIPVLYDMKVVQATGFLYDCYMLSTVEGAERDRYREAFWQAMTKNPPAIFVVSSHDCDAYPVRPAYNYRKISRWPLFDDYLKTHYRLDVERIPPHMVNLGSSPSKPLGYRIYVRNR